MDMAKAVPTLPCPGKPHSQAVFHQSSKIGHPSADTRGGQRTVHGHVRIADTHATGKNLWHCRFAGRPFVVAMKSRTLRDARCRIKVKIERFGHVSSVSNKEQRCPATGESP
jgi:hypothetical protein